MSARFRLPAGRSYNVRATELERDRQHTQVVCNVLLLDNTVQAFKVSVSTVLLRAFYFLTITKLRKRPMKQSVDASSDQYFTVLNACKTLLTLIIL